MQDFFDGLIPKIQEAVIKDFQDIQEQVGSEKIYAVVLGTDSSCVTLGLCVNTIEQMKKKDIDYAYNDLDAYLKSLEQYNLSDDEIDEIKNEPLPTTKWTPEEWVYESKEMATATVSKMLRDESKVISDKIKALSDETGFVADEIYDELHGGYYKKFIETVTTAFRNLIQSNAFGLAPENTTYFLHMVDDHRAEKIAKDSSKVLNVKNVHEEFLNQTKF
ncbi:MAG: DUF4303 domain-containing protein [Defluviitaleaceae bacterium]|nr:DUF4303 domain-containing protein [Defluviitaleaceae bacterium]MCL2263419.1 DUF4303 domain-containing protein [Defluviitaleaceae bacterium]